jgi:UDP-perosamine 4-acetyltransferase
MIKVIGFGAGGHARVVIDTLTTMGGFEIVGLLDQDRSLWNTEMLGVSVLGDDSLRDELHQRGVHSAFIGLGSIKNAEPRKRLYEMARTSGFELVRAIHPSAVVSRHAVIGDGPMIMAGAIINPAARIGNNVIINSGAIVEHDCEIADHSHVATGARLGGAVKIGTGSHVGLGASIREGIRVGAGAIVGAGAVVIEDVPDRTVVAGVPASVLRTVNS